MTATKLLYLYYLKVITVIIDILGPTAPQRFVDWNNQRTINWYPVLEAKGEKDKTQSALFPRPGLSSFATPTGSVVRGLFTAKTLTSERCFAVVDTTLYEITSDGTATSLGSLSNLLSGSSSRVNMEVNGNGEVFIQDTAGAYVFDMDTDTLTAVTDADYPGGSTVTFTDGYFVIADNNHRVSFSELNNGLSWSALDVFTPTFKADPVRAVVAYREELYCFGAETIEIYINDGSSPFSRQARSSIYYGLKAPQSLAVWHGGCAFVGSSRFGETQIYSLNPDYTIAPISTPAICNFINSKGADLSNCEGYIEYSKDGHIFYVLHVPNLETTLVYDFTTQQWHERRSKRPYPDVDGESKQDMFRGKVYTNFKGMNLYGDRYSGTIFKEDYDTYLDGTEAITRLRRGPVFNKELTYISVYELELDLNSGFGATTGQGTDPILQFRYSMDGGNTFEPEEYIQLGRLGVYDYRVKINKLGTARNWVIEFSMTDPVPVAIMQARASGVFGSW